MNKDEPLLDPCLPLALSDAVLRDNHTLHLRGLGDWSRCQDAVRPFLGLHNGTMSPGGVYQVDAAASDWSWVLWAVLLLHFLPRVFQAPINFSNSEFYGFSEFYYCMEDVLRIGGQYDSQKYSRAATVTNGYEEEEA